MSLVTALSFREAQHDLLALTLLTFRQVPVRLGFYALLSQIFAPPFDLGGGGVLLGAPAVVHLFHAPVMHLLSSLPSANPNRVAVGVPQLPST